MFEDNPNVNLNKNKLPPNCALFHVFYTLDNMGGMLIFDNSLRPLNTRPLHGFHYKLGGDT